MFANRRFFTDTIRAHAKPVTAFATSLVFVGAALPALAQQQEVGTHLVGRAVGLAVLIVGVVVVLLAILGVMVIFRVAGALGDPWLSVLWPGPPGPW